MSLEQCIEELYGDTWTDEEKALEVARIKAENSFITDEPLVKIDAEDEEDVDVDE